MGLDPENTDYEEGDACALCVDALFDGSTPKYVEAHVEGVEVCPGAPPVDPNGVHLLTQQLACAWAVTTAGLTYAWTLNVGQSIFSIFSGPVRFFSSTVAIACLDSFTNGFNACIPPLQLGKNGTVKLFWGPTIGP